MRRLCPTPSRAAAREGLGPWGTGAGRGRGRSYRWAELRCVHQDELAKVPQPQPRACPGGLTQGEAPLQREDATQRHPLSEDATQRQSHPVYRGRTWGSGKASTIPSHPTPTGPSTFPPPPIPLQHKDSLMTTVMGMQ